jgi:uncharacterized integral membrane protein
MSYLLVAVVAVAVAVFAMQNPAPVSVRFIVWRVEQAPLSAVVFIALAAGMAMVGLPLGFRLWRTRGRLRTRDAPRPSDGREERPTGGPPRFQ